VQCHTEGVELWYDVDDKGLRRRGRWHRREQVQRLARQDSERNSGLDSVLQPVTFCGRALKAVVDVRVHKGRAYAADLMTCGKIWTCPTCSTRIRARRELELAEVTAFHVARGGTLAMITLTVRHKNEMGLSETLGALTGSWQLMTNRSAWRRLRGKLDGFVRAVEITHGVNGWHPHDHVLLFVKPGVSIEAAQQFNGELSTTWIEAARKALKIAPSMERGFDFQFFGTDSAAAAAYVTKAAKELTFADSKSGRDPFALLDDPTETNLDLFMEYARVTHRRKAISWSRGLRAYGGLDVEQTDEELAGENEVVGVYVATIDRELWNVLDTQGRLHWLEFFELQWQLGLVPI